MTIQTVFAHVSCSDLGTSIDWYWRLFGGPPARQPVPGLAQWQFSESAEVQLVEEKKHAGHSTLTLGVVLLEPERMRLIEAGLPAGDIEEAGNFYIMRMRDPDGNRIVFTSPRKS